MARTCGEARSCWPLAAGAGIAEGLQPSNFEENFSAIHPTDGQKTQPDYGERIQQRCHGRRKPMREAMLEDVVLPTERHSHQLRQYVCGNGICAEDDERFGPPASMLRSEERRVGKECRSRW